MALFQVPPSGISTLTHYTLPPNYVASCGCVGAVTSYPTAAINRLSYSSTSSFGPQCGSCVRLTLQTTPLATSWNPIDFTPTGRNSSQEAPSVVVKLVDSCPDIGSEWCNATMTEGNKLGYQVHFDLAWPSRGISDDFFPGGQDYGVWTSLFEYVSCQEWDGYTHEKALGSDWSQQNAACCPADPPLPAGSDSTSDEPSISSTSLSSSSILPSSTTTLNSSSASTSNSTFSNSLNSTSTSTTTSTSNSSSSSRTSISASSSTLLTRRSHHQKFSSHLSKKDISSFLSNPAQHQTCPSYSSIVSSSNAITPEVGALIPNTSNVLSKKDGESNGALNLKSNFGFLFHSKQKVGNWGVLIGLEGLRRSFGFGDGVEAHEDEQVWGRAEGEVRQREEEVRFEIGEPPLLRLNQEL